MKTVINLKGEFEEVSIDTPVKTVNGIHYLLNQDDLVELEQRRIDSEQEKAEKAVFAAKTAYITLRQAEYGTAEAQLEYAVENGWDALVKRNLAIKAKYKKPK